MTSRRGSSRSLLRYEDSHKGKNSEKRTSESKQQPTKCLKKAKYNEINGFNYFFDEEELLETHGSKSDDDQSDNTAAEGSSSDINDKILEEGFSDDDEGDSFRAEDEEAAYDEIFKDFDLRKMVLRLVKRYELEELEEDTSPFVLDGSDITVDKSHQILTRFCTEYNLTYVCSRRFIAKCCKNNIPNGQSPRKMGLLQDSLNRSSSFSIHSYSCDKTVYVGDELYATKQCVDPSCIKSRYTSDGRSRTPIEELEYILDF
jgi:hypothetical protein